MQYKDLFTTVMTLSLSASSVAAQDSFDFTGAAGTGAISAPAAESGANVYSTAAAYTITSVAFDVTHDSRVSNGPLPTPVLLYSNGHASFDPSQITKPIDIDYDMVEHPENWPAWQRSAGVVQLQRANGWQNVGYTYEAAALPRSTRLAGTYEYERETVIGSDAAVGVNYRFRFYADGTYETCESDLTVIPAIPTIDREYKVARGSYQVDGYKITVTDDEKATTTTMPFFYDPQRPTRLWLGTNYYPTPANDISDICRKL